MQVFVFLFIELISIYYRKICYKHSSGCNFQYMEYRRCATFQGRNFEAGPRFQESSRYWDQSPTKFTSLAFKFLDFQVYFYCNEPSFLHLFLDEIISGISMSKMYLLCKDICYFRHFKLLSKTTATLSLKIPFFAGFFPFPVCCTL